MQCYKQKWALVEREELNKPLTPKEQMATHQFLVASQLLAADTEKLRALTPMVWAELSKSLQLHQVLAEMVAARVVAEVAEVAPEAQAVIVLARRQEAVVQVCQSRLDQ